MTVENMNMKQVHVCNIAYNGNMTRVRVFYYKF